MLLILFFFSCRNIDKKQHAKWSIYIFCSVSSYRLGFLNLLTPMCQICLMQFTASALSGPGPWAIGSPLSTQMYILAQSLPDPAVLCLFSQAARSTTETQRAGKEDRTREREWRVGSIPPADHQTDFLHASGLFMWRGLWPISATGSPVLLVGILSASLSQQDITGWK